MQKFDLFSSYVHDLKADCFIHSPSRDKDTPAPPPLLSRRYFSLCRNSRSSSWFTSFRATRVVISRRVRALRWTIKEAMLGLAKQPPRPLLILLLPPPPLDTLSGFRRVVSASLLLSKLEARFNKWCSSGFWHLLLTCTSLSWSSSSILQTQQGWSFWVDVPLKEEQRTWKYYLPTRLIWFYLMSSSNLWHQANQMNCPK